MNIPTKETNNDSLETQPKPSLGSVPPRRTTATGLIEPSGNPPRRGPPQEPLDLIVAEPDFSDWRTLTAQFVGTVLGLTAGLYIDSNYINGQAQIDKVYIVLDYTTTLLGGYGISTYISRKIFR